MMKPYKAYYRLIDEPLYYDMHIQIIRADSKDKATELMCGAREDIFVLLVEDIDKVVK